MTPPTILTEKTMPEAEAREIAISHFRLRQAEASPEICAVLREVGRTVLPEVWDACLMLGIDPKGRAAPMVAATVYKLAAEEIENADNCVERRRDSDSGAAV